jgi:lipopolysaccharide export system protein LptA
MFKEKLPAIGRVLSLLLLIGTIAVIVTAFIRARRQPRPPGPVRAESVLKANVTSVVEGYQYVKTDNGRETLRLLAAKDIAYEDGRHELEKVDLTAFSEKPGKSVRIVADRGSYLRDQSIVNFEGNVKVTSSDGLEVTTQSIKYEQQNEVANTDQPVQFRQKDLIGSSVGALVYAKTHNLALLKDAHVVSTNLNLENSGSKSKNGAAHPVELRGDRADYAELDGVLRFTGNVNVVQGEKSARAEMITGIINKQTKKLERIELRGNSFLKSDEKGKASEMQARDMDFYFDEAQHLKLAVANGAARARSLEKDSPREISAERIDAAYRAVTTAEKSNILQSIATQGRTTLRIEVVEGDPGAKEVTERVIEADTIQTSFQEDGKSLARAEANGNAVLTVTPKKITQTAEIKKLRSSRMTADFYQTGNAIKTFLADGSATAEIEPMQKESKLTKRTLSGKKITSHFQQETQDISELVVDGEAKFNDGERNATAARATYTASNRIVAMRGKPLLWDSSSRANADEIDANVDTHESFLRGRVRSTYYSRETTGGAAPFKDKKGPITIAADRAVVKHNEGAARYLGNVRSWQDDDFVRAENMELDKGERSMTAWGNAQSAFYDFEREVEKNRKEVVPVFAQADKIVYTDGNRTAHYEGSVKIRQGTDRIDAAVADAVMDEENRLVQLTAARDVVMTQPSRRATGDHVVYTAATDTAVLTGNLAMIEDREREAVTKSAKLTLHLRDARIEANDDGGTKKRVRTAHRVQN